MSKTALAQLLDRLSAASRAFVVESEHDIVASKLSYEDTRDILALADELGWAQHAYDTGDSEWSLEDIAAEFAPFRIPIRKPEAPVASLQLLTLTGFAYWLREGHPAAQWLVFGLAEPFRTHGRIYAPWGSSEAFEPSLPSKNPRSLVRENSAHRVVCADIRPWLLLNENLTQFDTPAFETWVELAIGVNLRALADEIDSEDGSLKFKGPPRLSLLLGAPDTALVRALGKDGFTELQRAVGWVFENEREAEMRHVLLATEVARSGGRDNDAVSCARDHLAAALEAAKIAYQMALTDLSRDTLKVLGDLRKAITEETAKVMETTRQIITSLAGALAVGIGLLAARVTTAANPPLIIGVMVIVALYMAAIILSGVQFVHLQRRLRGDWKPRLYRFIPDAEYQQMVTEPARRAESAFYCAAGLSCVAIAILTAMVIYTAATIEAASPNGSATPAAAPTPAPPVSAPPASGADTPPPNSQVLSTPAATPTPVKPT